MQRLSCIASVWRLKNGYHLSPRVMQPGFSISGRTVFPLTADPVPFIFHQFIRQCPTQFAMRAALIPAISVMNVV